ncbi:3-oxoacyl-[acyl-carrier-protein] reductase [Butyrivibrio sp. YAB3001]|uniref:3-oxoacyl-[acyl-carrier-protein] reductase n=1 Tax=Butyrivibrio sp. YAB3001 TaxID=1520812 RepID=UPI0008F65578|nr:3-oxoacyl-[acyl-carrier-protein] reductase [Butyrivibrio sp. YAB3001]SFC12778.1 3-oxoacyl-[acyl-carrier-protein] reductase [Butyrivibrio sp. YAB3001]
MFDFNGKNILVTGGSRGIGRALVNAFASNGASVAFIYGRSQEEAVKLEEEWAAKGVRVKGYQADVSKFESVKQVVSEIIKDFGKVDVLVNNAGITKDGYMMLMSEDNWRKVLDVNLSGTFNVTKQLLTHFLVNKKGKIINMTSVGGLVGAAGQTNYAASKAGIIGFTKSLTKEVAGKNINVNCIAPGYIATEMLDTIPDKIKNGIIGSIPASRLGNVDDIANAAMFLASDVADYINGQVLVVDGGLTA